MSELGGRIKTQEKIFKKIGNAQIDSDSQNFSVFLRDNQLTDLGDFDKI